MAHLEGDTDEHGAERPPILNRIAGAFREHAVIAVILLLAFLMRFYLSGQSYWFDEYLSAVAYGTNHASGWEAVTFLADRSIHPPLYQFILWYWMALFGDGEFATRSLSNFYLAGATLCLYLLVLQTHGKRLAIAVGLFFSLMYLPFLYGMETRSYAQTLFLVSLSSLVLFRYLRSLPAQASWRDLVLNRWFVALALANLAALLTHYYNVFFLGAQGLFLAAWFLARYRLSLSAILKLAVIGLTPLILLGLLWGPVMVHSYQKRVGRFVIDSAPTRAPWIIFKNSILDQNFAYPVWLTALLGLLATIAAVLACVRLARFGHRFRDAAVLYYVAWAVLPPVLAYVLFWLAGHERYSARYFLFCTPPLAVLLVLALETPLRLAARWRPAARLYLRLALPLTALAAAFFVAPDGYRAARYQKEDNRGIAAQINNLIQKNPDNKYMIFEVSRQPLIDYYLKRFNSESRVRGQIINNQEAKNKFIIDDYAGEIANGITHIIIAFTHDRKSSFPNLLKYASERYHRDHDLTNGNGRGIIIFSTKG